LYYKANASYRGVHIGLSTIVFDRYTFNTSLQVLILSGQISRLIHLCTLLYLSVILFVRIL